jgi:ubiquinone/menaquinone biosynthesis C-methylase UbiE
MATAPEPVSAVGHVGREPAALCCPAFYELDWVRQLVENIFHPGGEALTRKTVAAMNLPAGASIAELGCGTGTSAMLLAGEFDLQVSAVDISAANIERAKERAGSFGERIRFVQGDAQSLPFESHRLDAALAECTVSLFPDQPAALREIRRVLKPGGQLAVTDMASGGRLPVDIASVLAPWTCLADAIDQDAWVDRFEKEGFRVTDVSDESAGLDHLILMLKCKLMLLRMGGVITNQSVPDFDPVEIRHWLDRFREEVDKGMIRYLRFHLQCA